MCTYNHRWPWHATYLPCLSSSFTTLQIKSRIPYVFFQWLGKYLEEDLLQQMQPKMSTNPGFRRNLLTTSALPLTFEPGQAATMNPRITNRLSQPNMSTLVAVYGNTVYDGSQENGSEKSRLEYGQGLSTPSLGYWYYRRG
jgi:hypothetical protein